MTNSKKLSGASKASEQNTIITKDNEKAGEDLYDINPLDITVEQLLEHAFHFCIISGQIPLKDFMETNDSEKLLIACVANVVYAGAMRKIMEEDKADQAASKELSLKSGNQPLTTEKLCHSSAVMETIKSMIYRQLTLDEAEKYVKVIDYSVL